MDQFVVAKNDGELIYQGKQVEKISDYLIREGKIVFLQVFFSVVEDTGSICNWHLAGWR